MTTNEFTGSRPGPVTLHIDTQAADVEVVSDPRVSGCWVEVSTPDTSGPSADAVRDASFRDNGSDVRLSLREGQSVGNVQVGRGNYSNISFGNNMTMVNGVVIGGSGGGSRITVRAMLQPGSRLEVKTMSGDVISRGVTSVRAQTMSGDIEADGVTSASQLKSMSGDIRVRGEGRPQVTATTMSGDVQGSGVDLNASSMPGRVRRN